MPADERTKFDVACALAVLTPGPNLPFHLPETLKVDGHAKDILDACIDVGSSERSFCRLRNNIPSQYHVPMGSDQLTLFDGGEIRIGGSGVTIQLYDRTLRKHYALKVPRASVLAYVAPEFIVLDKERLIERISAEYKAFENERHISQRLSHENIARHFFGSSKIIPEVGGPGVTANLPFSISEWIDGAQTLHEFLKNEHTLTLREIVSLISETFSALAHIHEQHVIHWDLKGDNVLISGTGVAKIIDFGNAKLLDVLREEDLQATTTKGKYPEVFALQALQTGEDESRRFRIKLPDLSWNNPFIDLWMLAQEWNRCLLFSERFLCGESDLRDEDRGRILSLIRLQESPRSAEAHECLRIVFDRILFPFAPQFVERFVDPDHKFRTDDLYFHTATEVLAELARIHPSFGAAQEVPELLVSLGDIVRLPATGNSVFTDRVAALAETKTIQPTTLHNQLAQVRQVFPGATHTRFEHLLGTLTTAAHYLRALYLNDMNAFWRVSADALDVRAVLLASILHDAGHLAFGHFIEEMDDLMQGLKHSDYTLVLLKACLAAV